MEDFQRTLIWNGYEQTVLPEWGQSFELV
jgi:hypothetical protein